jgi:hypothetical protein
MTKLSVSGEKRSQRQSVHGDVRDPSLRLKGGSVRDDAASVL